MRKSLSILLLVVCMLGAFGCNADIETINYAYEYRIAQDLKEMSSKADIIVLGSYQKYLTSYNGDRDVKDPSKESTQSYSEVKIYEFKVDEVIKGNVPNDIHVNLHYSRQITELLDSKGNPIKLNIKSETFFEPELFNKYLLFLKKDPYSDGYIGDFHPFQIMINQQNKAVPILPLNSTETVAEDKKGKKYKINQEGFEGYVDTVTGKEFKDLISEIKQFVSN